MLTFFKIEQTAKAEHFDLVGITSIKKFDLKGYYQSYLNHGYYGQMIWLQKNHDLRKNPAQVFPQANSIISLAINYFSGWKVGRHRAGRGVIARYAWVDDYHQIIKERLDRLSKEIDQLAGKKTCLKICVDSAALLEKEIAQQAGLGFIGKNTQLITQKFGSFVFLAEIIITEKLPAVAKQVESRCGKCDQCLSACPTKALVKPHCLDARKCISYLTIEHRGPIPVGLRPKIGLNIFGCDKCQVVCPFNKRAKISQDPFFITRNRILNKSLLDWIAISEHNYIRVFKNSPIKRPGYRGFIRNVINALGNQGDRKSVPSLKLYLRSKDKLLAEQADWSIKNIERLNSS